MGFKHSTKQFIHDVPAPVFILWGCLLAVMIIALVADAAQADTVRNNPTTSACFSAEDWAPAPDSVRPCVLLVGNSPKAGTVRFVVSDASGTIRYGGHVDTAYHHVAAVYIVRVAEDGSFRYCVSNYRHRLHCNSIGNLED